MCRCVQVDSRTHSRHRGGEQRENSPNKIQPQFCFCMYESGVDTHMKPLKFTALASHQDVQPRTYVCQTCDFTEQETVRMPVTHTASSDTDDASTNDPRPVLSLATVHPDARTTICRRLLPKMEGFQRLRTARAIALSPCTSRPLGVQPARIHDPSFRQPQSSTASSPAQAPPWTATRPRSRSHMRLIVDDTRKAPDTETRDWVRSWTPQRVDSQKRPGILG